MATLLRQIGIGVVGDAQFLRHHRPGDVCGLENLIHPPRSEPAYGTFYRAIPLPEGVDAPRREPI
jgi:hypothetical protein